MSDHEKIADLICKQYAKAISSLQIVFAPIPITERGVTTMTTYATALTRNDCRLLMRHGKYPDDYAVEELRGVVINKQSPAIINAIARRTKEPMYVYYNEDYLIKILYTPKSYIVYVGLIDHRNVTVDDEGNVTPFIPKGLKCHIRKLNGKD